MVTTIKHPFTGHEVRVRETLVGTGVVISDLANSQMIVVHPESAPALALAILEAAGWPERESTSVTRTILSDLSRVVEFQERATAIALLARLEQAEQAVARVRGALSSYPRTCDRHTENDPVKCGWQRAVIDVQDALDGEQG